MNAFNQIPQNIDVFFRVIADGYYDDEYFVVVSAENEVDIAFEDIRVQITWWGILGHYTGFQDFHFWIKKSFITITNAQGNLSVESFGVYDVVGSGASNRPYRVHVWPGEMEWGKQIK